MKILIDFCYFFIFRLIFWIVFRFYKVEVKGAENIPSGAGCILAINHSSFLDAPLVAWCLRPLPIHWIVSRMIYSKWKFRPFCVIARSVPVNGSTKSAEGMLRRGSVIGIFPEGGICCDRLIKKGRRGVAVLAKKTGAPVVPCRIEGTFDTSKKVVFFPKVFTPLKLTIGRPMYFEQTDSERIPREILESTVREVIKGINDLAPGRSYQN